MADKLSPSAANIITIGMILLIWVFMGQWFLTDSFSSCGSLVCFLIIRPLILSHDPMHATAGRAALTADEDVPRAVSSNGVGFGGCSEWKIVHRRPSASAAWILSDNPVIRS